MPATLSFGYDGDGGLGDRLLGSALRGEKTATSSLAVGYLSGEPLPRVGQRLALVDHEGRVHGTVETTRVTLRAEAGNPGWQLPEHEPVVVHWFRLVE